MLWLFLSACFFGQIPCCFPLPNSSFYQKASASSRVVIKTVVSVEEWSGWLLPSPMCQSYLYIYPSLFPSLPVPPGFYLGEIFFGFSAWPRQPSLLALSCCAPVCWFGWAEGSLSSGTLSCPICSWSPGVAPLRHVLTCSDRWPVKFRRRILCVHAAGSRASVA